MKPIPDFDNEYFAPQDVLSPESLKLWEEKGFLILNPEAFSRLLAFRRYLGMPLYCNQGINTHRGTRTPAENAKIDGSATHSAHTLGVAFDLSCPLLSVEALAKKAEQSGLWTGIGIYSTWVHVDCAWRNTKTWVTWKGNH